MGQCVGKPDQKSLSDESAFNIHTVQIQTVDKVPCKDQKVPFKIVQVHDGDTVEVIVPYGMEPFRISIRILGIDTPEKRTLDPHEKEASYYCTEFLAKLLESPDCRLIISDWDKWGGRCLGTFYSSDNRKISDIMLENGMGRIYNGEKKIPWTVEELNLIISRGKALGIPLLK